jgi:hypothetical protein
LLWLLWRWGPSNYLSRLASNSNPPAINLRSLDYKHVPLYLTAGGILFCPLFRCRSHFQFLVHWKLFLYSWWVNGEPCHFVENHGLFYFDDIVNYINGVLSTNPTLHSWDKQDLGGMHYSFHILLYSICKYIFWKFYNYAYERYSFLDLA